MQHGLPGLLSKPDCVEGLVAELMRYETHETTAMMPALLAASILGGRIAAAAQRWQAQVDSVLREFLPILWNQSRSGFTPGRPS